MKGIRAAAMLQIARKKFKKRFGFVHAFFTKLP